MKRFGVISGLIVAATLALVGASLMQSFTPASPEAASEAVRLESASQADVRTLCREINGQAAMRLCLRSDGTGTLVVFDGAHRAEYQYNFFGAGAACPDAPANARVHLRNASTRDLLDFGFSQAEVADMLRLPERFCAYEAVG